MLIFQLKYLSVFIIIINLFLALCYKLFLFIFQLYKNLNFYVIKSMFYSFYLWYHALKDLLIFSTIQFHTLFFPFMYVYVYVYTCICTVNIYIYVYSSFIIWKIIWKCKLSSSVLCSLIFIKSPSKPNFLIGWFHSFYFLSFYTSHPKVDLYSCLLWQVSSVILFLTFFL